MSGPPADPTEARLKPLDPEVARILDVVHEAATSKLARDPVALDVREVSLIADVLYVCHADSTRAVDAIVDAIRDRLREAGLRPGHVEGQKTSQWVLIDVGDVIAHVFLGERRRYYDLEGLWHDADRVELSAA